MQYRITVTGHRGNNRNTRINNDYKLAKLIFDYEKIDAESEGLRVVLSAIRYDSQGRILNSCVIRDVNHYTQVDDI